MLLPPKSCSHPICNSYATFKGKCDDHQVKFIRTETQMSRSNDKFYNKKAWRDVRHNVLMIEPLCRYCKANGVLFEAKVVDHIIRRSHYDGSPYDVSNLQPLCIGCHNSKTHKEQRYYDAGTYLNPKINKYLG